MKLVCMMNSGHPITEDLAEALHFNAHEMCRESRNTMRIRSSHFDGVIESNLEVIMFLDTPAIQFEALIDTENWSAQTIRFLIRVDDLTMNPDTWTALMKSVIGQCSCPSCAKQRSRPRPRHAYEQPFSMN